METNTGYTLIVKEAGQMTTYRLDEKKVWMVGRVSKSGTPDVRLTSSTVSRTHGRIMYMDGSWFYVDNNSKNGTTYNGEQLKPGLNGRLKPIIIKDGDSIILGGSAELTFRRKG